jgi:citrate lyase subunit beta/citryl-CoA lyase
MAAPALPRSFLYVPAVRPDLFAKASDGGADAVVLDLEDAVPLPLKSQARHHVRGWLADRHSHPGRLRARRVAERWVRVDPQALTADLEAVVGPSLDGIFLAKCTTGSLDRLESVLADLEPERGLRGGSVQVIGLVESAQGILSLAELVRHPRLVTLGIGEADLLGDLRMTRSDLSAAAVDLLRTQVVLHCAAAGLSAPVAPTSTAFRDLDAFARTSRHLLDLGFRSRTAVHPGQVGVINEVFSPDEKAVTEALAVVARFEAAEGGVTTDSAGRLIDAAVVREAQETLSRRSRQ